jgi:hypothetical protein
MSLDHIQLWAVFSVKTGAKKDDKPEEHFFRIVGIGRLKATGAVADIAVLNLTTKEKLPTLIAAEDFPQKRWTPCEQSPYLPPFLSWEDIKGKTATFRAIAAKRRDLVKYFTPLGFGIFDPEIRNAAITKACEKGPFQCLGAGRALAVVVLRRQYHGARAGVWGLRRAIAQGSHRRRERRGGLHAAFPRPRQTASGPQATRVLHHPRHL